MNVNTVDDVTMERVFDERRVIVDAEQFVRIGFIFCKQKSRFDDVTIVSFRFVDRPNIRRQGLMTAAYGMRIKADDVRLQSASFM